MASITPLSLEETKKKKEDEDVGFFESAFAGIATGLWNIPKGIFSLGAELVDLLGDTNSAKGVEEWFDEVNPFDDEAEARTVGKITQALTQIGIPAVKGFQIGSQLAARALAAKKAGKHMSLSVMGKKIMAPSIGTTTGGVIGAGVGEAVVSDEEIGTFGDMLQGTSLEPLAVTMMDKSTDKEGRQDAYRRLKNRLKFGTEGALFNVALIGAGKGIKNLGKATGITEYSKNSFGRAWQKWGPEGGFRVNETADKNIYEGKLFTESKLKSINRAIETEVDRLNAPMDSIKNTIYDESILPEVQKIRGGSFKEIKETSGKDALKRNFNEILNPADASSVNNMLKPEVKKKAIQTLDLLKQFDAMDSAFIAGQAERNPAIFRKALQKLRSKYVNRQRSEARREFLQDKLRAAGAITDAPGREGPTLIRGEDGRVIKILPNDPNRPTRRIDKSIALKREIKEAYQTEVDDLALLGGRDNFKILAKDALNNMEVLEQVAKFQGKITPEAQLAAQKKAFEAVVKLKDEVMGGGIFKETDYRVTPALQKNLDVVKKYGGETTANTIQDQLIKVRMGVDNMSALLYGKPGDRQLTRSIGKNFGKYLTSIYRTQEGKNLTGLKILDQYKVLDEEIVRAKNKYVDQTIINRREEFVNNKKIQLGRPATLSEISAFEEQALKEVLQPNGKAFARLLDEAEMVVEARAKQLNNSYDPSEVSKSNLTKKELQGVKIRGNVLERKVLKPWEEEVYGISRDPTLTTIATTNKLANVNYTIDFLNQIARQGSGIKGFVKTESQIADDILNKEKLGGKGTEEDVLALRESLSNSDSGMNELRKIEYQAKIDAADPLKYKKYISDTNKIPTALDNKYIQTPQFDPLLGVRNNWLNSTGNIGMFYKLAILGPKAGSQITKTILSPLTHVRNLLSAGAFVAANGAFFPSYGDFKMLMPETFGGQNVFKQAYGLTGRRVLGTMTDADELLYQRLLAVGVTDSQVQAGEMKRLIRDMISDPAGVERSLGDRLPANLKNKTLGQLKKIYAKTQDAYVAEDDFWKIINWSLERNRYSGIVKNLGINKDNIKTLLYADPLSSEYKSVIKGLGDSGEATAKYFRNIAPRESYIKGAVNSEGMMENFLDEVAGNLTRNQVPNYAYIGRTGQALRMSPFGNFIAFPLEIMRTGHNIFEQSLKEINSGVPGLQGLGYKRLISFGTTVGGVPYGLTELFKVKNDVTDDEMQALRKFVPEWSKNSTLLPMGRDEEGNLKYVDFSYSNAYDTLIRPFNAIMNSLGRGEKDPNSLKAALGEGITESMVEILKPYASESIFTEALIDSTFRKGVGSRGKRIWSNEDETMVKMAKGIMHVAESFKPGSYNQLVRMGRAAQGKTDEYGQMYNLQDELSSLYGMREITSDPLRSLRYMTTDFGSKLKTDNNLFIGPLLKGGRVSPQNVIQKYKYSQSRKFQTVKEMYQNIEAARTLGVSESKIRQNVTRKGIDKETTQNLFRGIYTPQLPNKFFVDKMQEITRDLNTKEGLDIPNPYREALPAIRQIIINNRRINLTEESSNFYGGLEIEEPIQTQQSIQPLQLNNNPTNITQAQPVALNSRSNIASNNNVSPLTNLTSTEEALLSPGDQIIRQRQRERQRGTA